MDITFKQVNYIYQPNTPFQHQALKDISFHIPDGKFVAIIGHTGSGKSTLIQHLNGLLTLTSGVVTIGNYSLSKEKKLKKMKVLRSKIGIVFQYTENHMCDKNVKKDIAIGPQKFVIPHDIISHRNHKVNQY